MSFFSYFNYKFKYNKTNLISINNLLIIIVYIITLFSQISCSIYRMDIRQGIEIEHKQLARLKPKLSKKQVESILGVTNLNPINIDRLDYYYLNKTNNHKNIIKKHLVLYFNNNELVSYDGDIQLNNLPRRSK